MTFSSGPTDKFFSVMDRVAAIVGRPFFWLSGILPDGQPISSQETIPLWQPVMIAGIATLCFSAATLMSHANALTILFFMNGGILITWCGRLKLRHPLYQNASWNRDEREQQMILTCKNSALIVMSLGALLMPFLLVMTVMHQQFFLDEDKSIMLCMKAFLCLNYFVTLAFAAQIGTLAWLERNQIPSADLIQPSTNAEQSPHPNKKGRLPSPDD